MNRTLSIVILGITMVLMGSISVLGQGTIEGTVTEQGTGDPIPGVNVIVQGTTIGSSTNADGEFVVRGVPQGSQVIEARFIGYKVARKNIEVVSDETLTVNFQLVDASLEMDQIVVTGTGGQTRRKEIGNSLESISTDDIETATLSDFGDVLQGRTAGATIMDNSGQVGAASTIRLRGGNSFSQGNQPLIFIDGIRVSNRSYRSDPEINQAAAPFDDINPNDIARVEVVKGAAATTIYGTEASGGVIQIFTKQGAEGVARWSASVTQGFNNMPKLGPDIDPTGLGLWDCEGIDPGCPSSGTYHKNGHIQRYNLSVRGGGQEMSYYISGKLNSEDGVFGPQGSENYGMRANFGFRPSNNLNLKFNSSYTYKKTRWTPDGNNAEGFFLNTLRGPAGYAPDNNNSLAFNMKLHTRSNHFTTGMTANWTPMQNMLHKVTLGIDYSEQDYTEERPFGFFFDPKGDREADYFKMVNRTIDYTGSFNYDLNDTWTSGTSWGAQMYDESIIAINAFGEEFGGPGDKLVDSAARTSAFEDRISTVSGGFFVQEKIGYNDRLFITGGVRVDGHSTFGDDFGLAVYPKISGSFIPSDYDFWPEFWNTMKLRAAYGESGRAPSAFAALRTWSSVSGDEGQPAVTPQNLGNPDLGPERTGEFEIGFESSFLNDLVYTEFTYYRQSTKDALVPVQPAPSSGFVNSQLENVGELENKGIEAQMNINVIQEGPVQWSVGGHYSTNKSEAVDLGDVDRIYVSWRQELRTGYSVPSYFHDIVTNPDAIGVDPEFEDQYIGPSYPTHTYGINTSVTIKDNFRINVLGEGQGGHVLSSGTAYQNVRRGQWPTCTDIQTQIDAGNVSGLSAYDRAICDPNETTYGMWTRAADFFKIRSASVSYRLPNSWLPENVRNATLKIQGKNLLTFTDYPGLDPEAFEDGARDFVDYRQEYYNIPPMRTFIMKLNIGF